MTVRRLAPLLIAAICILACESLIGASFGEAKPLATAEAGPINGTTTDAGAPCMLALPPERPQGPSALDDIDFTVVVSTVDYGDDLDDRGDPKYLTIGYDLDGTCTGPGEPPSCAQPSWLSSNLGDGPGGRDNAVGRMLFEQEAQFGVKVITSELLNESVALGIHAPLGILKVGKYGGFPEDDRVEVDWYAAAALGQPPSFGKADAWPVLRDSVADPTVTSALESPSVYRDEVAYVTRGTLVARFAEVVAPMNNVYFRIRDVVLTGTLLRDVASGEWMLRDALVAGRGKVDEFLRVIPEVALVSFDVSLCTDNAANYPPVKRLICNGGDMPEVAGDSSSPCTGASVAVRLGTRPATLGAIVEPPTPAVLCTEATDPSADTCAMEGSP